MGFQPSKYQQDVFNFITRGSGHAIVEAVAGSGKTTTIVEALKLIPQHQQVVFLAFNKDIAMELGARVPKHVQASTLNSLGARTWNRATGNACKLNADKIREIMTEFRDGYAKEVWENIYMPVRKLVGLARAEGLVPAGMEVQGLVEDTDDFWDDLIDHHDIYFGDRRKRNPNEKEDRAFAIELARTVLRRSIELATTGTQRVMDFDDQLYLPVIFDSPTYQFDWVFVDEAQDVSAIQRALVTKALKRNGRLVCVGDPCQAIYSFRGADSQSLENIARQFNAVRLPLSVSYRCPKAVVAEAQMVVSHIEPHDGAKDGRVEDRGTYSEKVQFAIGDLVVCRANAPLVKLAYKLISRRIPVKVMGRDIGAGLVSLIEKLNARTVEDLVEKVQAWHQKESERRMRKDPESDLSDLDDKREVIMIFAEETGANTIAQVISAIQNLFSGDRKAGSKAIDGSVVNLSTIHKSKGLEAHNVWFLNRSALPSRYAKKPHQIQTENNLIYVAITRAKEALFYLEMPQQ